MDLAGLPYVVTPMTLDDVPTIAEIERAVFTMPWSSNAFRYEISHNRFAAYLALRYRPWMGRVEPSPRQPVWRRTSPDQLDRSILGYGGLWMMVDEGHVCTLGVRAEWRGRGLGELLLLSLIEAAYERGANEVTLEVRESNLVAQSLYGKYGMQVIGRRRGYYTDNREDALIMSVFDIAQDAYQDALDIKRQALRQHLQAFAGRPPAAAAH